MQKAQARFNSELTSIHSAFKKNLKRTRDQINEDSIGQPWSVGFLRKKYIGSSVDFVRCKVKLFYYLDENDMQDPGVFEQDENDLYFREFDIVIALPDASSFSTLAEISERCEGCEDSDASGVFEDFMKKITDITIAKHKLDPNQYGMTECDLVVSLEEIILSHQHLRHAGQSRVPGRSPNLPNLHKRHKHDSNDACLSSSADGDSNLHEQEHVLQDSVHVDALVIAWASDDLDGSDISEDEDDEIRVYSPYLQLHSRYPSVRDF